MPIARSTDTAAAQVWARAAATALFLVNGATFGSWVSRIPDVSADLSLSEAHLGLALFGVAAGAIAAIRTKYPPSKVSPATLRSLVYKTADDLGGTGYDHNYGWGAIEPVPLAEAVAKAARAKPA